MLGDGNGDAGVASMTQKDNWGWQARIGMFIVSSEAVPEAEWWAMLPPNVSVHAARVTALHKELIELTAEADDALMEKFFEQGNLTEEQLRAGEHTAVQKQAIIPLFFTGAEGNVGVARMMDFIAPSP